MFLSLRLAALTLLSTALFISTGLAVPLYKRFVLLHQLVFCWKLKLVSNRSQQLCNLRSEFCDRKYGNITFVGAHDSFASSPNPFARKQSALGPYILFFPFSQIVLSVCSFKDSRGGCLYSVKAGCEVVAGSGTNVRSNCFSCFSVSYIYVHSSRNGKDLSFCHTSQF